MVCNPLYLIKWQRCYLRLHKHDALSEQTLWNTVVVAFWDHKDQLSSADLHQCLMWFSVCDMGKWYTIFHQCPEKVWEPHLDYQLLSIGCLALLEPYGYFRQPVLYIFHWNFILRSNKFVVKHLVIRMSRATATWIPLQRARNYIWGDSSPFVILKQVMTF